MAHIDANRPAAQLPIKLRLVACSSEPEENVCTPIRVCHEWHDTLVSIGGVWQQPVATCCFTLLSTAKVESQYILGLRLANIADNVDWYIFPSADLSKNGWQSAIWGETSPVQ